MTKQEKLYDKYYRGETTLEEERELKSLVLEGESNSPERDIFGYYAGEGKVPEGLEDDIFASVEQTVQKKKTLRMRLYSALSAAAVLLIVLSVYLDIRKEKVARLEDDFFVMEQALFRISESIQPQEQEEMLVLWVDNDVEIIIN